MSAISKKIRDYVKDFSVSDSYGKWGILNFDQRFMIRKLCDTCDMFESEAKQLYTQVESLKKYIARESCLVVETDHGELTKQIKSEAYEEFAERLLTKAIFIRDEEKANGVIRVDDVYETLEKLVGDAE